MPAFALAFVAAVPACYAPAPAPGAPCADDVQCPSSQRCVSGRCGGEPGEGPDAGGGGGGGGGGGSEDAAIDAPIDVQTVFGCASADTCAAAVTLGAISGDTNNQTLTASGHAAAWFRIRVTENDSAPIPGRMLRLAAKLAVPGAVDFDVRIYVNAATDLVECSTTIGTPSMTGNIKLVRAMWGEVAVGNNANDGRDVSIEVRPLSGTCDEDQPWQLTLEGNWN